MITTPEGWKAAEEYSHDKLVERIITLQTELNQTESSRKAINKTMFELLKQRGETLKWINTEIEYLQKTKYKSDRSLEHAYRIMELKEIKKRLK